jgi:hypothetical protein
MTSLLYWIHQDWIFPSTEKIGHHVVVNNLYREFRKVIYHSDVRSDMTHASMH